MRAGSGGLRRLLAALFMLCAVALASDFPETWFERRANCGGAPFLLVDFTLRRESPFLARYTALTEESPRLRPVDVTITPEGAQLPIYCKVSVTTARRRRSKLLLKTELIPGRTVLVRFVLIDGRKIIFVEPNPGG